MWKRKLKMQLIASAILIFLYGIVHNVNSPIVQEKVDTIVATVSMHYTVEDMTSRGKQAASALIQAPVAVTSRITASQESQKYGVPIGQVEEGETTSVYASAGGKVIKTGNKEALGNYIVIEHDTQISTYGNCHNLYVKEGEHVRKGQVIASYVRQEGTDFYYCLSDK